MAANVLSRIAVVITANTAQMVGQLGTANKKLGLMSSSLNTLKNTMLGTFGAYAVLHAIQNTVKAIAEFDKEITAVKAITGTTGKDFDRLRDSALQLGTSTQFAATKVAGLQLEFARLGFSNTEILQSTEATIDLATATGEDLARSAEIAGSTLRAFQIDASEMSRVTDVMSKALNESALTLDNFADGIKYVAPVAHATGVSLEETAALLSVLSDAGIKGTQAGTSLRRIFTLLTKDGGTLQERLAGLAETGITLANANDEVGLYAQTALLQIVAMYPQVLTLTEGMDNAGGETKKLANVMKDNLRTALDQVYASWNALILKIEDGEGHIKDSTQTLAKLLRIAADGGLDAVLYTVTDTPGSIDAYIEKLDEKVDREKKGAEVTADLLRQQAILWRKAYDPSVDQDAIRRIGGQELLDVMIERQRAGQSKITQATLAANEERQRTIDKLKEETDAREKLIKTHIEEARLVNEANARDRSEYGVMGESTPLNFGNTLSTNKTTFADSVRVLLDENEAEMAEEVATSYERSFQKITEAAKVWGDAQDELTVKSKENSDVWRNAAASIADDLGQAFATLGEETKGAAKALARAAIGIINTLEQITLAQMIADSSKYGIPGIIAAAAGFGVVKGIFARIARESRGSSVGGGGYNVSTRAIDIKGEFRLQGSTLVAGLDKANYSKTRI